MVTVIYSANFDVHTCVQMHFEWRRKYTSGMPRGLSIDKPQWLIDSLWLAAGQLSAGLLKFAGGLEPTKRKSS
jgi:hypothetical protein